MPELHDIPLIYKEGVYSIVDFSQDIEGDNRILITMVRCAKGHPSENFRYAVEIMSKHIEEHALAVLHKTEDFKYICAEYD